MTLPVVLVHGAFHGSWCWERVVPMLGALGVPATAPELPYTSWEDDLACVRAAVHTAASAADKQVLLVGHSLGGGLVCEVGADPAVGALGYVSALVVGPDETIRDRMTAAGVAEELRDGSNPAIASGMGADDRGHVTMDARVAADVFFSDLPAGEAVALGDRLRPISVSSLSGRPTEAPWRTKPASYLFCTRDRALTDDVQEAYAGGLTGRRDRLESSHSPFWSRPAAVAGVLADWTNAAS